MEQRHSPAMMPKGMEPVLTRTSFREQPFCDTAVGNYHLLRQLGSGGSAHVYLAEHIYLKSLLALKLLTLSSAHHEEVQHFQLEARILAHLRHQHIVQALDFGWERGVPFLVMEYAPGEPYSRRSRWGKLCPSLPSCPPSCRLLARCNLSTITA